VTLTIAFWMLFVSMGVVLTGQALWQLVSGFRSRNWPRSPGTILSSELEGPGDGAFRAAVSYSYSVGSDTHLGTRVFFGDDNGTDRAAAARTVFRYRTGSPVSVAYDPHDPSLSVLETGQTWHPWLRLGIGALFVALGLYASLRR